jgi:hypothetical protein
MVPGWEIGESMVVAVGGPLVFGLSHLGFFTGSYLAGTHYAPFFFRGAMRTAIEKMGSSSCDEPPVCY